MSPCLTNDVVHVSRVTELPTPLMDVLWSFANEHGHHRARVEHAGTIDCEFQSFMMVQVRRRHCVVYDPQVRRHDTRNVRIDQHVIGAKRGTNQRSSVVRPSVVVWPLQVGQGSP